MVGGKNWDAMDEALSEHEQHLPEIRGYQLVEQLGAGGMGLVYRAVQLSTGREVALKILKTSVVGSPTAVARFKREVQLAARLEHPNIARVYDADVQQGLCFYSMQLIRGLPLHDFVQEHRLSRRQIMELVLAVCRGVAYAHDQGVVHRDLKPSNIFVDDNGVPYLLDFGLAKAIGGETTDFSISMEGTITGTPGFMAPEQAAGQISRVAKATDVYSLGAILYYLLTQHFPHDVGGTQYEVLRRIAEEDVTPPDVYAAGLAPELTALLRRALQREPEDRFPDAGAMAAEIARCLSLDQAELENFEYGTRRSVWPWWVAAGLTVVVAVITIGLAFMAANARQRGALADTEATSKKKAVVDEQTSAGSTHPKPRKTTGEATPGPETAIPIAGQRPKGVWAESSAKLQALKPRLAQLLIRHLADYTEEKPLHLAKPPEGAGVLLPELDVWLDKSFIVFRAADGSSYRQHAELIEPRTSLRILMVLSKLHPQDKELVQLMDALRRHPQVRESRDPNRPRPDATNREPAQ